MSISTRRARHRLLLAAAAAAMVALPIGGARAAAPSQLTVSLSGGSGSVTSGDGKISCPAKSCSASYEAGALVDLTATPAKDAAFAGWGGAAPSGCGKKPSCTVTVGPDATAVSAAFTQPPGPGHPLPPPILHVLAPANNTFLDLPSTAVSGDIDVHTSPFEFCLVLNDRERPDTCDGYPLVNQVPYPYTFRVPVSEGLHPGLNTITAWLIQGDGQFTSTTVTVEVASPANGIDFRTVTIEATQGTQWFGLPFPPESTASSSIREAAYNGVRLAQGGRTVVRVYADALSTGRPGRRIAGVRMLLDGYSTSGHRRLPGSPLAPIAGPATLGTGASRAVPPAMRSDPRGAYTFDVPASWTREPSIELVARVNPPDLAPAIPECRDCIANNTFRLTGVRFWRGDVYEVFPLKLRWRNTEGVLRQPAADSTDVFADAATMTPAAQGDFRVHPYAGEIDVTAAAPPGASNDAMNGGLMGEVFTWQYWNTHTGMVLGVQVGLSSGLTSPALLPAPIYSSFLAVVNADRPRTSVAHEFWHMLGSVHASNCSNGSPTGVAEPWPPDQRGYLEGYGLDPRGVSGPGGPYRIMGEIPVRPTYWYDFMSYCANTNESDSWISTRNWDRRMRGGGEPTGLAAGPGWRAAAGPTLSVTGVVETDGALRLLHVGPGTAATLPSVEGSPYTLTMRDRGGAAIARVGVTPQLMHVDRTTSLPRFFVAQVPAAGVASVALAGPGAAPAVRTASAHAPTVAVVTPRAGSRVGAARTVLVSWRARDADGDALTTAVDYSANDGATWKTLTVDAPGGSYALQSSYFAGSKRARIRVRVGDGFNETAAVSGRFTAVGSPPVVHITSPAPGKRIPADANLVLAGQAFDDAQHAVKASKLRWYDGKRAMGGTDPSVLGLRPGVHRIRLAASDSHGRTGTATVLVRVTPVRPALLGFRPPRHLSPTARRVVLRVAATVDSTLRVGGQRYAVGRKARAVAVRVRPGRAPVVLRLRLSASGLSSAVTVTIARSSRGNARLSTALAG